jgi:hypothetical protein
MRLRLEQRDRIEQRLKGMLVAPRPDYLATAEERILGEQVCALEQACTPGAQRFPLRSRPDQAFAGGLDWHIHTEYDRRFTEAHQNLHELNQVVELLKGSTPLLFAPARPPRKVTKATMM